MTVYNKPLAKILRFVSFLKNVLLRLRLRLKSSRVVDTMEGHKINCHRYVIQLISEVTQNGTSAAIA